MTVGSGRSVWRAISAERQLTEEAQRDRFAIRLGKGRHGGTQVRLALGAQCEHRWIGARADLDRLRVACCRRRSPRPHQHRPSGRPSGPSVAGRPGAGRSGPRCGSATHRTGPRHASSRAIDRRSRTPPGQRPRPRGGRRGPDGKPARWMPICARPDAGRHHGRRPGRRRRWRGHRAGRPHRSWWKRG